jgi:stress-induced morphogen
MAISREELFRLLKSGFPDGEIKIDDLAGDNNHYAANIKSSKFKGKTKVQQHQMVYASLKGKMGNELHALALTTEEK